VPGGLLLALASALVHSPLLTRVAPSIGFYYFAVFTCGLLLAWRFNSSRVLFSLLLLLLAHRAVEFFAAGHGTTAGPGRTAVIAVELLLPLNCIALAFMRERGLVVAGIAPRFGLLFLQSVVVAVLCRPENAGHAAGSSAWGQFPAWAGLSFVAAVITFGVRYWQTRKPIETGFVWSLAAVFLWLYSTPIGKTADAYVATAGLLLVASIIETSYVLAYHDELTGIPGRRAFNEALLSLDQSYAIAIVDIDHFKKFNDTYGHDIGDQVLRMVASRLAEVGGAGRAFRCGGEEFAIVFNTTAARDAAEVLERLRQTIQSSSFRLRGSERRSAARAAEGDRRKTVGRRSPKVPLIPATEDLSVTVSIGVAEPGTRYRQPEQVIQAADQALYRAKHNGRNRVEVASIAPLRVTRSKRASASRS
jgi:diguanylate cyclase (GGDEF)-like protein